jgi:hypothetical protein
MSLQNSYNFKEGAGLTLTDRVAGAANGTLAGVLPVWSANGYLKFTGGNGAVTGNRCRVNFTNRTPFDYMFNSQFSEVVIFRSSKADANLHFLAMNSEGNTGLGQWLMGLTDTETFRFLIRCTNNKTKLANSSVSVCDGKWHIAVLTYNNNTCICYLDSKVIALTTNDVCSGNFYNANSRATLGARYDPVSGNYFYDATADICYFRNFNHALSVAEVNNIKTYYKGLF